MEKRKYYIAALVLLSLLIVTYSNHFHNAFHFDDSHTITNNLYIRDVKNIPLFFKDSKTFSSLPSNQSYRPLVTTTLALDYRMGNGLDPFCFHLHMFILFVLQGVLMFFFFKKILSVSVENKYAVFVALFAVAWYLLHPAIAETVNYVIARSDLLSTFFVLLAFVMYVFSPLCRKYFLYLLPVVIGALAKVPAIMFAPLLLVYVLLFEKNLSASGIFKKENFSQMISALLISLPSFILCGGLYFFIQKMEPTWVAGGSSRFQYFITQPYVIFHYARTFFFPFWLSADTDWTVFDSILNLKAVFGFIFCTALLVLAVLCSGKQKLRPISFGIAWFFVALIPTSSIVPLAEVMNDHRMYFPFVGLALSFTYGIFLLLEKCRVPMAAVGVAGIMILSLYAFGAHERNEIWRNDVTLWKDVTEKSPGNPRGLMNYGLALMAKADYKGAEDYFQRALKIWPDYAYLHINMGVLKGATGHPQEAEQYFLNAISYRGDSPETYYYYASFLHDQKRDAEAVQMLQKTLERSQAHILGRDLLMAIYYDDSEFEKLKKLAEETLQVIPGDTQANYYLEAAKGKRSKLDLAIETAKQDPSPENYLNLSLAYYNAGKFVECIHACEETLKLKPDYSLAYNNMCSAYNQLGNWDKAIEAGRKAVQLDPGNRLAKNNLEWAEKQKVKSK
jgi:tetratricopeptide (TPR) repeat protein